MYIGVAASPRDRLAKQVMPSRIGHPWTLDHPPPATVCTGRNLLNTVLKDQRDGRPLIKCFGKIDTRNSDAIEALNAGFRSNRRLGRPVGGVSNRPAGTGFVSGRSLHLRSGLRERGPAVTGRPLFEAAIVRAQLDVIWTAGRSGGPFKLGRWKRKEDQGAANRDGVTRESPKTNRTGAGVTDAIRPRTRPGVRRTTGGAAGRRGERPRARQRTRLEGWRPSDGRKTGFGGVGFSNPPKSGDPAKNDRDRRPLPRKHGAEPPGWSNRGDYPRVWPYIRLTGPSAEPAHSLRVTC